MSMGSPRSIHRSAVTAGVAGRRPATSEGPKDPLSGGAEQVSDKRTFVVSADLTEPWGDDGRTSTRRPGSTTRRGVHVHPVLMRAVMSGAVRDATPSRPAVWPTHEAECVWCVPGPP